MKDLAEEHNIIIEPTDKGPCVVVWDPDDYLGEADRQVQDKKAYESSSFTLRKVTASFNLFRKEDLLVEKNLSSSLINIRRPLTSGEYTYSQRFMSV